MTWHVGVEVRNSAWLTWKRLTVEAETVDEAAAAALRQADARKVQWAMEHDDYCPDDFTFRVIGMVKAA